MSAHIFIQGEKFTNTRNIIQWIESRTGWPVLTDSDLIRQAGSRFGLRTDQLERDLSRRNPVMKRTLFRQRKAAAYLKRTLAEMLRSEAGIIYGIAGHLIPPQMPHVLRVLVTAETTDRLHRASRDRHILEKRARRQIEKTDYQSFLRHRQFSGDDGVYSASYDAVVPTDVLDTEAAARLILDHLSKKAGVASETVERALNDFALAAEIQLALAEKGYDVDADAEDGRVQLTIDHNLFRFGKMSEKLKHLVIEMPDVTEVEIKVGANFYQTDIYRRSRFEMSQAMQFKNYAQRRRHLRRSAIDSLPVDIQKRPETSRVNIGERLGL